MSATIKGSGIFWSIGGITFTAGLVDAVNHTEYVQSIRFARTSEKTEVKDDGGTIKAVAFHGKKKTLSITVIPNGADLTKGKDSADDHTLIPGTLVTIADASMSASTGVLEQSYNVITSTQNRTVDGVVTIDLELEGSDEGVDITTVIS